MGEAWSKKGSISVLEFITSSLTGLRNSTLVVYDEDNNPTVTIKLDMDDALADYYFPEADTGKFNRLLNNFVPYYCDLILIYSSLFLELEGKISGKEDGESYKITENSVDEASLGSEDDKEDLIKGKSDENVSVDTYSENTATNRVLNTLNTNFYTNCLNAYDTIYKSDGSTEIVV